MNKSAKTWLLFMMIPFFIGVLIHFIVPLEIIISANPKLEDAYNGYKIEVEQNTVRALAFLNNRVITNRFQMYENMRSTLIRLFERSDILKFQNFSQPTKILSAYELASTGNIDAHPLNTSMWYSPNATSFSQVDDPTQREIFNSYIQAQPFIDSIYNSQDEIYRGLIDLEVIMAIGGYEYQFQYPAQVDPLYNTTTLSVLNKYYQDSMRNRGVSGSKLTIFNNGPVIRLCSVVIYSNQTEVRGVVCIGLDIDVVTKDITSVLGVPQFELSTNNYYLLKPLYEFERAAKPKGEFWPEIIANFSSNNLPAIEIPTSMVFSLTENSLSEDIFDGNRQYQMNIQRNNRTNTYYTIPVVTSGYDDTSQICIYLVVLNNFAKAELTEQSRNQRIAIIMIIPSVLLLLISILVTTLILRSIMRKLSEALELMGEYCSLIKRGDLELEIPEYKETSDLRELFEQLQKLNQLNKCADVAYFNVPKPERIIRLLKCVKLFDELCYDKANLYENIAQCYVQMGDNESALKYLGQSVSISLQSLYGCPDDKLIDKLYMEKVSRRAKPDKNTRKKQKAIKRRILRMCFLLYTISQTSNTSTDKQLASKAELLRKITYPDILNYEYITCLLYIVNSKLKCNDLNDVDNKMQILYDLIKGYQEVNEGNESCQIPPDIMYSYWYSLAGVIKMQEGSFVEAYDLLVRALQGNHFHPIAHKFVHRNIEKILEIHNISKEEMKRFKYMEQYKERQEREYIFLFDVGKPNMGVQAINSWKKRARKMTQHIFNKLVRETDRISITEFCLDIKIVCNLIEKGNREKILKKELMSSIKARDQTITALLTPCLRKSIDRARNLKKEKVFLVFLKAGQQLNPAEIDQDISQIQNAKFLFFFDDTQQVQTKSQNYFVLGLQDEADVNRILEEKVWREADNIIYIL